MAHACIHVDTGRRFSYVVLRWARAACLLARRMKANSRPLHLRSPHFRRGARRRPASRVPGAGKKPCMEPTTTRPRPPRLFHHLPASFLFLSHGFPSAPPFGFAMGGGDRRAPYPRALTIPRPRPPRLRPFLPFTRRGRSPEPTFQAHPDPLPCGARGARRPINPRHRRASSLRICPHLAARERTTGAPELASPPTTTRRITQASCCCPRGGRGRRRVKARGRD
jgi:hypothetical protein